MPDLSATLGALSTEQAAQFFVTADAGEIASLIGETDDRELRRLIANDTMREAAVGTALDRFHEFAVPERLAEVTGVVRFVVTRARGKDDMYDATFANGAVDAMPPSTATPDVTITTDALDFLRLISGSASAALLLLSGRLLVTGDENLALQVGGVFKVPGSLDVAVNPAALDAVEVAGIIAKAKDSYLRDVMKGGFREVILAEIFRRFPDYIDAGKARNLQLDIGFKIAGDGDDADRFLVSLDNGACTVTRGGEGKRTATIALGGVEFLKLATGNLNPAMAFIRGQLKVRGDISAALSLSAVMRIPSARG